MISLLVQTVEIVFFKDTKTHFGEIKDFAHKHFLDKVINYSLRIPSKFSQIAQQSHFFFTLFARSKL